jgi:hypothetical protein
LLVAVVNDHSAVVASEPKGEHRLGGSTRQSLRQRQWVAGLGRPNGDHVITRNGSDEPIVITEGGGEDLIAMDQRRSQSPSGIGSQDGDEISPQVMTRAP